MSSFTLPCTKCGAGTPQEVYDDRLVDSADAAICPARGVTLGVKLCPDAFNRHHPLVNAVADAIQAAEGDEVSMAQAAIRAIAARSEAQDTQRSEARQPIPSSELVEAVRERHETDAQIMSKTGLCFDKRWKQAHDDREALLSALSSTRTEEEVRAEYLDELIKVAKANVTSIMESEGLSEEAADERCAPIHSAISWLKGYRALRSLQIKEGGVMGQPRHLDRFPLRAEWHPWWITYDGDPACLALYERHYSAHQYRDGRVRKLFMGPGEKIVLRTEEGDAAFGWRRFIDASGQTGINCSFFRNESRYLSSFLIRVADQLADLLWPRQRHYTYVNPSMVRSSNPGACFKAAGWRACGKTKSRGLLILERPTPTEDKA